MSRPYYQDESVTIYNADCREVLPSVEGDVCISDPPYSEETHAGARTGGDGSQVLVNFASIAPADLIAVFSLLRIKRWCVATVDWRHIAPLSDNPPSGLRFVRFGAWVKPNGSPQFTGDRPAQGWEAVAILHAESGEKMRWNGGGHHAVWTVNKQNSQHPTGKPTELINRFVTLFSDEGETIIDPFMGAGTTLYAAKNLGRRAVGIEIDERYCEIAAERCRQGTLFGEVA